MLVEPWKSRARFGRNNLQRSSNIHGNTAKSQPYHRPAFKYDTDMVRQDFQDTMFLCIHACDISSVQSQLWNCVLHFSTRSLPLDSAHWHSSSWRFSRSPWGSPAAHSCTADSTHAPRHQSPAEAPGPAKIKSPRHTCSSGLKEGCPFVPESAWAGLGLRICHSKEGVVRPAKKLKPVGITAVDLLHSQRPWKGSLHAKHQKRIPKPTRSNHKG